MAYIFRSVTVWLLAIAIAFAFASATVQAQSAADGVNEPRPLAGPGRVRPYDSQLLRLAEIIGALHHLHPTCAIAPPIPWRARMQALIDAETPSGLRKRRMIARFNRGYRAYARVYRACTPAARQVIVRYLDEGARLARSVTVRYAQ